MSYIRIQAKDFDGNKCKASVGDILFCNFFIDTQREDGLYSPVEFCVVTDEEFEDQYEEWVESLRR